MAKKNIFERFERRVLSTLDDELSYYVGGQGEATLVIMNAFGHSIVYWEKLVSILFSQFRVIIWEMRGTKAGVGGVDKSHSMEQHLEDAAKIIQQEVSRSFYLIAWCTAPKLALALQSTLAASMIKGMIFLNAAFKYKDHYRNHETDYEADMETLCGLVNANPARAQAVFSAYRSLRLTKAAPAAGAFSMNEHPLMEYISAPLASASSIASYSKQLREFWDFDATKYYETSTFPLLMIAGEADDVVSPKISRFVSPLIPGSTFLPVDSGSHYLQYDNAELIASIIEKFVDERLSPVVESNAI